MGIKNTLKKIRLLIVNIRFLKKTLADKATPVREYSEVEAAYERLVNKYDYDNDALQDLKKLKATAESGYAQSHFFKQIAFGPSVAKAMENWFIAFDNTSKDLPLLERIPRSESTIVLAKWLRFGFYATLIGIFASLSVAGITAFYLTRQTDVLSEQATNAREASFNAQRTQYTQILYDQTCEDNEGMKYFGVSDVVARAKNLTCTPVNNFRIRSEAAKAFLNLQRSTGGQLDLSMALLNNTNMEKFDLSGVNLFRADLDRASLYGVNLTDSTLAEARLDGVNLIDANLAGANLSGATLDQARLLNANMSNTFLFGTDMSGGVYDGTDFSGADLSAAFVGANGLPGACGDKDTKLPKSVSIPNCK